MSEDKKEVQEIRPMMRVKSGVDETTGKATYDLVDCKPRASGKVKKLLDRGKKKRFKLHKPKELNNKEAKIYAEIIEDYEIGDLNWSEPHLINEVNKFLNKNPRIKKRYFKNRG